MALQSLQDQSPLIPILGTSSPCSDSQIPYILFYIWQPCFPSSPGTFSSSWLSFIDLMSKRLMFHVAIRKSKPLFLCVGCLGIISPAFSCLAFWTGFALQGGVVGPSPNSQPGGPGTLLLGFPCLSRKYPFRRRIFRLIPHWGLLVS